MPDWLQGDDLSQTIEIWGAILSAVIALATIFQVLVTYLISRSIGKASALSESLEISRIIDAQWQEYNKLMVIDEQFRATHRSLEGLSSEKENVTQTRYLIFYILNVIYTAWTAAKSKKDHFDHSKTIMQDHLAIIYTKKELVIDILDSARGYNKFFIKDCKEAFAALDKKYSGSKDQ